MRPLHSLAGIVAAVLVSFMAITGAILSVQPALDAAAARATGAGASVAMLAGEVAANLPGVESLTRSASGMLVAYYSDGSGLHRAAQVDPASGAVLAAYEPSGFFAFFTELHRSLFLGDAGHAVAGLAALALVVLATSGMLLLAARMGGWRRLFARARGTGAQRLHTTIARVAVFGLALTALTGIYMSALTFGLVPDGSLGFAFPPGGSGGTPAPVAALQALAAVPLSDLRELVFPIDASDVFTLTTSAGQGYVDQATGALISFTPNSIWQQLYETIYMLHTGEGAWWLGLLLGAAALAVPVMATSGLLVWWNARRSLPRLKANAPWRTADTVILVGSETSTTWSFAATLHDALSHAGYAVHTAAMNTVRTYPRARRVIVLAATYGDGSAPASAHRFLGRLAALRHPIAPAFAVLGFGDRSFARYCGYAEKVDAALLAAGLSPLLPFASIDRQSAQAFAAWGRDLGDALGAPLSLSHAPVAPRTRGLILRERLDFGMEVQAPTAVLRFEAVPAPGGLLRRLLRPGLPRFSAGDLVGILPPGSSVPRYYSLASASSDGMLEICVRKQTGGLCSEYLHALAPGEVVQGFVRANPDFRPARGGRPLILIGAGSGVAPLAGIIRHNRGHRPAYLFFGARDPDSDFLYRADIEQALVDGRLTTVEAAFSRVVHGAYVQDRLIDRADLLRKVIAEGGQVLVCGGLEMARGVRGALDAVLQPAGLSTALLREQGRYLEDAY